MSYRLGKKAARHDARNFPFTRYRMAVVPPPPETLDLGAKVSVWPMYLNDKMGDCTCAAVGHMAESCSSFSGATRSASRG
jgi:hypothetical protein